MSNDAESISLNSIAENESKSHRIDASITSWQFVTDFKILSTSASIWFLVRRTLDELLIWYDEFSAFEYFPGFEVNFKFPEQK